MSPNKKQHKFRYIDKSQPKQPVSTVKYVERIVPVVHHGLEGLDDEIDKLLSLYEELQLVSVEAGAEVEKDFFTFALTATYFGVITARKIREAVEDGKGHKKDVTMTEAAQLRNDEEMDLYADPYTGDEPPTGINLWANYVEKKDRPYNTWDSHSFNTQESTYPQPSSSSSTIGAASSSFDDGVVIKRYHNIAVYEYIVDGIACKRRIDNDYIQVDPLLDVAYLSDTKKHYVVEEEVLPHCPEAARYASSPEFSGIWVPLKFARHLAWTLGIDILLQPLFDFSPSAAERGVLADKENFGAETNRVKKYDEANVEWRPMYSPIWPADTNNLGAIGFVYLYPTVSSNIGPQGIIGELNVGIILRKEYRGDGYAKKALTTVLDYAFKTLSCHRVQALIVENYTKQHALTLFTQLKFTHEGTRRLSFYSPLLSEWKDVTTLSLLATDWALRDVFKPAPVTLWDELFTRHERERQELLRWEEKNLAEQRKLLRTSSMETIRVLTETDPAVSSSATESEAGSSHAVKVAAPLTASAVLPQPIPSPSSTDKGKRKLSESDQWQARRSPSVASDSDAEDGPGDYMPPIKYPKLEHPSGPNVLSGTWAEVSSSSMTGRASSPTISEFSDISVPASEGVSVISAGSFRGSGRGSREDDSDEESGNSSEWTRASLSSADTDSEVD